MLQSLTHTTACGTRQPSSCRSVSTRKAALWAPSLQELLGLIKKTNPFFHFFFNQHTLKGVAENVDLLLKLVESGLQCMRNHASRGLADAFILGSTQGWYEFRHGLNFGEAEHCLRCCAGTSSSLSSFLDGSGDIGKGLDRQAELDAFCSHRGSHGGGHRSGQVAGVPVWLQKATRRDSYVCIFKILYIHTCVYVETA